MKSLITLTLTLLYAASNAPSALAAPPERIKNSLGMEFVLIPAGPFRFGFEPRMRALNPGAEGLKAVNAADNDYIVWLSKPYYLQTTEVTQGQWKAIMDMTLPELCAETAADCAQLTVGAQYPVTHVKASQITDFITRLGERDKQSYRLPTRPEWERAASAGQWRSRYFWGDDPRQLRQYENCQAPGDNAVWPWLERDGYAGPAPVASFGANPFGLYDMLGNVSELTGHATVYWQGFRQDPSRHFSDDVSDYLRVYTDFPRDKQPDYPYRDAAGGNYRRDPEGCTLSAGGGLLLDNGEETSHSGSTASATVGFRLLLEVPE